MGLPIKMLDRFEDNPPKERPLGLPFIASIGQQIINEYGISKDAYMEKLYQHVHDQVEKKSESNKLQEPTPIKRTPYEHQARERVMHLDLESRGVHTRPEMFPHQRRRDEALNNQRLEPQGKLETCSKFKDTNLLSLHVGETVLRTKLSQGGGYDVDIPPELDLDILKESSRPRELSHSAHKEIRALLTQELVDEDLAWLHSFSQCVGFIPKGFPHLVFNEATDQGPSPHVSYLALEQESKGAHHTPLLQASPLPYPDSLVPFMKMGLDEYEDDFLRFGATAPNKSIQSLTSYLKKDSKESSANQRNSPYKAMDKLLQLVILNPFVKMAMLFLFQPKKPKPKEAFGSQE